MMMTNLMIFSNPWWWRWHQTLYNIWWKICQPMALIANHADPWYILWHMEWLQKGCTSRVDSSYQMKQTQLGFIINYISLNMKMMEIWGRHKSNFWIITWQSSRKFFFFFESFALFCYSTEKVSYIYLNKLLGLCKH